MYKNRNNKYGEITSTQLLIVLIAGLLTWIGVNSYHKYTDNKVDSESTIIALPPTQNDEIIKLKSENEILRKQLEEKGKTIISLGDLNKDKDNKIIQLESSGINKEELNNLKFEYENLKKQLEDKAKIIITLENLNKDKDNKIKQLESTETNKEELVLLKSEYENLVKQLEDKGKKIISLENINNDKENKINQLKAFENDTVNLRNELNNRNNEIEKANNSIIQLNLTNESLKEDIKKAKEGIEKLYAVISVLKKENISFKEEKKIIGTIRKRIKDTVKGYSGATDFKTKYIVLTQSIDAELSRNEVSTICGINVGEADLRVVYLENKIQYYVDLERLSDQDVQYDMDSRSINIYIASPKLDEDVVEIQSNPEKIIKRDKKSWITYGIDLEKMKDDIQAKVRNEVLEAGSQDMYKASARRNAKEKLTELFNKILGRFLDEKNLDLNVIVYD